MPQVAREALNYFYKTDPDVGVIARIVQSDAALTGTILKLANSVRFVSGSSTSDVKVAIGRIGLNALRQILMTHAFAESFQFPQDCPVDPKSFWRHGAFVAEVAHELALKAHRPVAPDLQLAGLTHDLGVFVRALNRPQDTANVFTYCKEKNVDMATAEMDLGLKPHREISAMVVKEWKVPELVEALVLFHDIADPKQRGTLAPELNTMIDILYISDVVAHRFGGGFADYQRDTRLDPDLLARAGLDSDDVFRAMKNAKSFLEVFLP